jgi:hypothetical protein
MKTINWQKNNPWPTALVIMGLLLISLFLGCGGDSGGDDGDGDTHIPPVTTESDTWQREIVRQLQPGGLLTPRIRAHAMGDDMVHLAYFDDENNDPGQYDIRLISWPTDGSLLIQDVTPTTIATIDNCSTLDLAIDADGNPAVSYQGGAVKDCGGEDQADAMISLSENDNWVAYTAAIGFVERNPVFTDGLAGGDTAMAMDANGDIHLAYQFFYEGCDAMNFAYPDLKYVKKLNNAPGADVEEETIEGNVYYSGGGVQNNVGNACSLVLDRNENPRVFYYAELPDGVFGLRTAIRQNGVWEAAWIETDIQVSDISSASDKDGNLGVAYYVRDYVETSTGETSPACLRYAAEPHPGETDWHILMVDDASLCGKYPSLAFKSSGEPVIAYHTAETYSGYLLENLNLAEKKGSTWEKDVVSTEGNIGLYNNLWFLSDDSPVVCTYSLSDQTIYLFKRGNS